MRFRISRASDWKGSNQPCAGAVRDGDDWFIEIADLNALVKLVRDAEGIIMTEDHIQIYDAYVE